ncbi:gliding motility protein [Myxococcus stipitatus]|uniref:gliding motility protein n=1 Tax=Myxococcus stipitatus TaxID=83455 RepID=UPI0030CD9AC8
MKPTPGDIFAVFTPRLGAYTAVQVTALNLEGKTEQASVLALDWVGSTLPDAEAVAAMAPATFNFFFWKEHRDHLWVSAEVPRGYTLVGNRPPLVVEKVNSYGGWPSGHQHYSQRRWEAIPKDKRDVFKALAAHPDNQVALKLGERELSLSTGRLHTEEFVAAPRLSVFDALPMVTAIDCTVPIPGLFDFLRERPFIYEARIAKHGEPIVDLRGSNLSRLRLDVTGVREVHLNVELEELQLTGTTSPELMIHAEADGRWLTLSMERLTTDWSGLAALDGLHVSPAQELDVAAIVPRFPKLTELRVWGAPGYLRNAGRLAGLPSLTELTLSDMFGISAEEFPGPEVLPQLGRLWLTSIPADLAASVKKAYKAMAREGLDLSVRQPRKAEWLAENLDNPFRTWDGVENITPAQAKKAAALYRQARSAALEAASEHTGSPSDLMSALTPIVTAYTQGFNKLDARSSFIFTEEREHIYVALMGICDAVDERLKSEGGASAAPLDRDAITSAMDSIRDF